MTAVEEERAPAAAQPTPPRRNRPLAVLLNSWRQLTSMRTALVLLFLLAIAAIPGSVLPQNAVNAENVTAYYGRHPQLAPWIERLGGFDVYSSAWFSAIYLLLFTSLVGCVLPRLADHVRALRAVPPVVPRRLERLPQHAPATVAATAAATAAGAIATSLRGFRTKVRDDGDGSWTVSAEKGYAKETGNLLFHGALLAVLIGVGFGHWYGWHGNRLLVTGKDNGFCMVLPQFDESSLGPRVGVTDLPPYCLTLDDFRADYQADGQPKSFSATISVDGEKQPRTFSVNKPLRLDGANVYLLGHGYAPILRYTDRYGRQLTKSAPFLPVDQVFTSDGVVQFPDVNVDPKTNARDGTAQMAFQGRYLPTVPAEPPYLASMYPAERNPAAMLTAYRGNLGLDVGLARNVYQLDQGQIARGELKAVGTRLLREGETWTLDDGTSVQFVGTLPWATLSVRYDPTSSLVLVGAVAGLAGLMLSLTGRRRRIFFRITPAGPADRGGPDGASLIEAGGLPRTDYPGFADEFTSLVAVARSAVAGEAPEEGD